MPSTVMRSRLWTMYLNGASMCQPPAKTSGRKPAPLPSAMGAKRVSPRLRPHLRSTMP